MDICFAKIDWNSMAAAAGSLSYADLTRAADEAIKDAIIHDRERVTEVDLRKPFEDRKAIRSK